MNHSPKNKAIQSHQPRNANRINLTCFPYHRRRSCHTKFVQVTSKVLYNDKKNRLTDGLAGSKNLNYLSVLHHADVLDLLITIRYADHVHACVQVCHVNIEL